MNMKKARTVPVAGIQKFFYGRVEAAQALALSPRSIDYMIADGRLETRRWGKRVLIPAESVQRMAQLILSTDGLQGVAQISR